MSAEAQQWAEERFPHADLGAITEHFAALQAQRLLALSFEMIELHPQLNFKQNNVHAFLSNQAG